MPKSRSLSKSSSYMRKLGKKIRRDNRETCRNLRYRACLFFAVFSLLLTLLEPVGADWFLSVPPQDIVVEETCIYVSSTNPANSVFINVTEYDAQQIVKNITLEFCEPVAYVSFVLDVLSEKPPYADIPHNETVRQYYTINFLNDLANKIINVTMIFAIEKVAAQERNVEVTLVLYRYNGGKMKEYPAEKFAEDDAFWYFKTVTEGTSYIAVTRAIMPTPWWFAGVIIATVALMAVIGIYIYKRFKLAHLRKMVKT